MIDEYPNKFTVKELIDILNKFSPDMRVVTHGQRNGYENILHPGIITVYRNEESMSEYEGECDTTEIFGQKPVEVVAIFRGNR